MDRGHFPPRSDGDLPAQDPEGGQVLPTQQGGRRRLHQRRALCWVPHDAPPQRLAVQRPRDLRAVERRSKEYETKQELAHWSRCVPTGINNGSIAIA